MLPSQQTRTFNEIIEYEIKKEGLSGTEVLNNLKNKIMPSCLDFNDEEYAALIGRYAESHIRYQNEGQFWAAFFTISIEGIPKLRTKLEANKWIRGLEQNEVLQGEQYTTVRQDEQSGIQNQATNPDTEPPTENFEPLPYINGQVQDKTSDTTTTTESRQLGIVGAISNWKHQLGSQAYNEFLDGYRDLFTKIFSGIDIPVYRKGEY